MSTAVPLTAQQIYQRQAQQTLTLYLYNPQDKPVSATYDGVDYTLPGANEYYIKVKKGRVVEQHDEPGVLPVRGHRYHYKYDNRVVLKKIKNHEGVQERVVTPEEIVEYLVGPDRMSGRLGPAGVRLLTGDPAHDKIIKDDARETWLRKTYEDARVLVTAHEAVVAAATATGKPVPILTPRMRNAYKTIAAYEAGGAEFAFKHACPICGDRLKDDDTARSHVMAYHPAKAAGVLEKLKVAEMPVATASPYLADEEAEALAVMPEPPKRGPGRPKKAEAQ